MTTAFVLGNGKSRLVLDLHELKKHGPIYGCNALYREFVPDVLVATDTPIANVIQESGYAQKNRFYTRKPMQGLGGQRLPKEYLGFSSGPNALGVACRDGHERMFLIGFDLGSNTERFNNVYADTQFYKKSTDVPTYSGNWVQQIFKICEDYPNRRFVRVCGTESQHQNKLAEVKNLEIMSISEFQDRLNTPRGLL